MRIDKVFALLRAALILCRTVFSLFGIFVIAFTVRTARTGFMLLVAGFCIFFPLFSVLSALLCRSF